MVKTKRRLGVSRRVTHIRASVTAPGGSNSQVLASEALAHQRQESRRRYAEHISGLSNSSIRTLQQNTVNLGQDTSDSTFPEDNHAGEWQDVVDEIIGDARDRPQEDEEMVDIVYDMRDIITSQWKTRWYKDHRTWKLRRERFESNWQGVMEDLTSAYLEWRTSQSLPRSQESPPFTSSSSTHPQANNSDYNFSIDAIDIYTLPKTAHITQSANTSASTAIALAGYLGNTPIHPSLAISFKTLELLRVIKLHRPSFSIEAFARTICYFYLVPYRRRYRNALSDTFDVYLDLRRRIDNRVATLLGRDAPDYRVLHACPPCSYELNDEPNLRYQRMIVIDGNNSLKRIKGIGNRQMADKRTFQSDYFLSPEFVDQYANEVKSQPAPPTVTSDDDIDDEDIHTTEGDPTDGDLDSGPSTCTDNWKAAAKEENKKMWAIFSEAGIFASACRHGFILWIADMIASGELAKYPLAILAMALQVFQSRFLLGYDVGCKFEGTILGSSLGSRFRESGSRCCVNAFHGYSHHYHCQLFNHPNTIEGMGLEDLETLERVFSASNALGAVTRYMTAYRRRVFIDLHFRHWDSEKYANLANMLHQNYRQALAIIESHTLDVQHILDLREINEDELHSYLEDERTFFTTLGKEPEDDLHAIAYAELLEELWAVDTKLDDVSSLFRTQTPAEYQFVSPELSYSSNLSETRRTDTARRQLIDRRERLLLEICQFEVKMNIHTRWTPSSLQYRQTAEYMRNRKYERALDTLQSLVIKRLFELHKLNLSQTAYRMRTHIAKSLQTRSKTIRAAITRYNTLAVPLGRPTLDWSKVTHYGFLDEFNLLRHTRWDIQSKPWADPVIRETMRKYQRLLRVREEIIRCNIELRRLHTSIVDENRCFDSILQGFTLHPHVLEVEVRDYILRRQGVNKMLLARIFDTYSLDGFSGVPTPGSVVNPLPAPNLHLETAVQYSHEQDIAACNDSDVNNKAPIAGDVEARAAFHDSGVVSDPESGDELGDDEVSDIGGLVEFMTHLS